MHYILFYKTVEGYIEKRAPYREERQVMNIARPLIFVRQ
jgi:hypothetical protein